MWLYLLIFLFPVIVYAAGGSAPVRRNTSFLFFYLLFLALFVGLGDMLGGYDRYIYGDIFDRIADATTTGASYDGISIFEGEKGYNLLNILISKYTANRYIFILSITLIIYTLLFIDIRRYVSNYPFAVILFMGLWFFFTFTYLRQVLAATIAWLAIRYIVDRKLIKFTIVCLIAYSIHNSALIFFPLYFVPVKKFSPAAVITVMAVCLLLGLSPLPGALFNAYDAAAEVERGAKYSSPTGFRIEYFLEAGFFLFVILSNYRRIVPTKINIVMLNISLVFCAVLLVFIRSDNGGRLAWYFMLGLIATITNISTNAFSQKFVPAMMVVLCLGLYLRVYTGWQAYLNLYPYKTFLTNGYREGDYSWENYEYDHNYDADKLYRPVFR